MIELRKPRITKKQREGIKEAYKNGVAIEVIVEKFNVAQATIYRIIREK